MIIVHLSNCILEHLHNMKKHNSRCRSERVKKVKLEATHAMGIVVGDCELLSPSSNRYSKLNKITVIVEGKRYIVQDNVQCIQNTTDVNVINTTIDNTCHHLLHKLTSVPTFYTAPLYNSITFLSLRHVKVSSSRYLKNGLENVNTQNGKNLLSKSVSLFQQKFNQRNHVNFQYILQLLTLHLPFKHFRNMYSSIVDHIYSQIKGKRKRNNKSQLVNVTVQNTGLEYIEQMREILLKTITYVMAQQKTHYLRTLHSQFLPIMQKTYTTKSSIKNVIQSICLKQNEITENVIKLLKRNQPNNVDKVDDGNNYKKGNVIEFGLLLQVSINVENFAKLFLSSEWLRYYETNKQQFLTNVGSSVTVNNTDSDIMLDTLILWLPNNHIFYAPHFRSDCNPRNELKRKYLTKQHVATKTTIQSNNYAYVPMHEVYLNINKSTGEIITENRECEVHNNVTNIDDDNLTSTAFATRSTINVTNIHSVTVLQYINGDATTALLHNETNDLLPSSNVETQNDKEIMSTLPITTLTNNPTTTFSVFNTLFPAYIMKGTHFHISSQRVNTPFICPLMDYNEYRKKLVTSKTYTRSCRQYVRNTVFELTDDYIRQNKIMVITSEMAKAGIDMLIDVEDENGNVGNITTSLSIRKIDPNDAVLKTGLLFGNLVDETTSETNPTIRKHDGNHGKMQLYGLHTHLGFVRPFKPIKEIRKLELRNNETAYRYPDDNVDNSHDVENCGDEKEEKNKNVCRTACSRQFVAAYAETIAKYFPSDYAVSIQSEYCRGMTNETGEHPSNGIMGIDTPCMYTVSVNFASNQHIDPGDGSVGFLITLLNDNVDKKQVVKRSYLAYDCLRISNINGKECEYNGVAVELDHGILQKFDGRLLRHGTTIGDYGLNNRIYGIHVAANIRACNSN